MSKLKVNQDDKDHDEQRGRRSFEDALAALLSPAHQATTPEALQQSAARRTQTISDMRHYWKRIAPHSGLPTPKRMIHITGTKGKGSTASLCQAIAQQHGYSTGLFTSPHLMDIRERIRLDGLPCHSNIFAKAYWKIRDALEQHAQEHPHHDSHNTSSMPPPLPGYFRMLTLMAFYIFDQLNVDIWIIEVGMGGRYDATNFLDFYGRQVVCGITLLDLDHVRILGNTLEKIAWEKAGILCQDKETTHKLTPRPTEEKSTQTQPMVESKNTTTNKPPDANTDPSSACFILNSNTQGVYEMFQKVAQIEGTQEIHVQPVDAQGMALKAALGSRFMGLAGNHQYGNATLAIHLVYAITLTQTSETKEQQYHHTTLQEFLQHPKTLKALEQVQWPARCQTLQSARQSFVFRLDGAHTPHSMTATMDWFCKVTQINPRRVLVFHCSHERNPLELLRLVKLGNFTAVYFAKPDSTRPSPVQKPIAEDLLREEGIPVRDDLITSVSKGKEAGAKESWQETLGILWKHLMWEEDQVKSASTCHATHYSIPLVCNKNSAEILSELSSNISEPTEVLVTGSLYMVGSFLTALEWSEKSSPDLSSQLS